MASSADNPVRASPSGPMRKMMSPSEQPVRLRNTGVPPAVRVGAPQMVTDVPKIGDFDRSPPARGTLCCLARLAIPPKNSSQ